MALTNRIAPEGDVDGDGSAAGPAHGARLTIGFYALTWPAEQGKPNGILTYIGTLVPALRAQGHRVAIVCLNKLSEDGADLVINAPLPPLGLPARLRGMLAGPARRAEAMIARRAEALAAAFARAHAIMPLDLIETEECFGYAPFFKSALPVPVITRLHGPCFAILPENTDTSTADYAVRYRHELAAFTRSDALSAPSAAVLGLARREVQGLATPARVVPNPVPTDPSLPKWSAAEADPKLLVLVARFDRVKGSDVAIRAFARLMDEDPSIRALIIGPDGHIDDEDGERRTATQYIAYHAPAHIDRFELTGRVSPATVADMRRRGAVCVVPSRFEVFCYAAAEAMLQGMPLIASDTGGIPEVVGDPENAILVPPGDVDALASALRRVIADPVAAAAMGARGAAAAASRLTVDAVAPQMIALYRDVIAAAARPGGTA